jgi:acyl transferase domain-containing protein
LVAAGIEHRRVNLAAAAHYRGLDPHLPRFRDRMATTTHGRPQVAFYSTAAGARVDGPLDVDYWAEELRGTVRFADAVHAAAADGPFVGVELAPGKVLAAAVGALHPGAVTLGALGIEGDGPAGLLQLAGGLWSAGVELDLGHLVDRSQRRIHLPVARLEGPVAWVEPTRTAPATPGSTPRLDGTGDAAADRGSDAPTEVPGTLVLRVPQWQPVSSVAGCSMPILATPSAPTSPPHSGPEGSSSSSNRGRERARPRPSARS